jgi:ADP-ribosylglycohydrolase
MRAMPIAMYFFGDRNKLLKNTVDSCIISHNTDVAIDAAIAVNVTLESLIKGMSKSDAIEEGLNATKKNHGKYGAKTDEPKIYERVQTALRILKGKSIDEAMGLIPEQIGVSWFARETIPGAFANYMVSESPEDSSLLSMRCGGDNNTVPEIACAFIGAEKGPEVFPKDVLKGIESVNHVKIMVMINKLLKKMGV